MSHYRMPFYLLQCLAVTALILLSDKNIQGTEVTLFEVIEKGMPTLAWMTCNMKSVKQICSWHLGPLNSSLSIEDSSWKLERHRVEIDTAAKTCNLKILNIKFEDEGAYRCYLDGKLSEDLWRLDIKANPGSPVILFANGTIIPERTVVIDDTPLTINLKCWSSGAKPKQEFIHWEVNDEAHAKETSVDIKVSVEGLWDAFSTMSLNFSEEDGKQYAVKRVACIVDHATGQKRSMKVFGVRNMDKAVHLVHDTDTNVPRGRLKCQTNMFPRPSKFQIVKMSASGNYTHLGPEVDVKEEGRYVCSIAEVEEIDMMQRQHKWLGESNVIAIGVPDEKHATEDNLTTSRSALMSNRALCVDFVMAVSVLSLWYY